VITSSPTLFIRWSIFSMLTRIDAASSPLGASGAADGALLAGGTSHGRGRGLPRGTSARWPIPNRPRPSRYFITAAISALVSTQSPSGSSRSSPASAGRAQGPPATAELAQLGEQAQRIVAARQQMLQRLEADGEPGSGAAGGVTTAGTWAGAAPF
jgi:hypothetical protein